MGNSRCNFGYFYFAINRHCLGACQIGGSVIDWVMKAEGVSFRHAVEILLNNPDSLQDTDNKILKRATKRKLEASVKIDSSDQEVLRQTIEYYHKTLKNNPDAMAYLKKRGLINPELMNRFKLGFSNRTLGLRLPEKNRKTIRKYIEKSDWNKNMSTTLMPSKSKLDKYKPYIDSWLEDDKKMRRKQRHTAKRVFTRLQEMYGDEFDCSYRLVAGYVSAKRKAVFGNNDDFYLPLKHKPGEAQIDFGEADFIENGKRYRGNYLNVSFPYSNAGFMQLFKGENFECLAQGMADIFEYIGGVPNRQWFDNMSTAVQGIKEDKSRELTEAFSRLKHHYNFKAVFCNLAAGNEKGNVESKVGYHRRNLLVPIPEFKDLEQYNKGLLEKCTDDMEREHYKKGLLIKTLFEDDKKNLIELPTDRFKASKIESVKTDAYAKFRINKGRYTYSTMPKLAKKQLQIEITAHEVIIYDEVMKPVLKHKRLYGNETESMNWLPYLTQLAKRPNAIKYTGMYDLFPYPVQQWLINCKKEELSKALTMIAEISDKLSFKKAVDILQKSIEYEAFDPDSIKALYELESQSLPDTSGFELPDNMRDIKVRDAGLTTYDLFILGSKKDETDNAN